MGKPLFDDWHLFVPKSVEALREGYSFARLRADALAGLTVAIVALPLSMALAIASGVPPERGLYTAIIGGFLISALGGVRQQIGGPAGAFVVIVFGVVRDHGYDGLVIATLMAGFILVIAGLLRVGAYIKYIPHPVVVGFTSGIAFIIFTSQIGDLLGLKIADLPANPIPKLAAYAFELGAVNPAALVLSAGALALMLAIRRAAPGLPFFLIGIVAATGAALALNLPVETIGTRFGGVPNTIPAPQWPAMSLARIEELIPSALTIAFLAGVESLLCAVVADGMTGRRHRSNVELTAQGLANIASVSFGGIPVTGTIARTATNIRAGAQTPLAGMFHAAFVALMMLVLAPFAKHLPMAALAAVLVIVAWNMAELRGFMALMRAPWGDRFVLLVSFALTVLVDLTVAIQAGVILAAFIFMDRMARMAGVEGSTALIDGGEESDGTQASDAGALSGASKDVQVFQMNGPFFFAVAATLTDRLRQFQAQPRVFILRMGRVPLLDASGAHALKSFVHDAGRKGTRVILSNVQAQPRRMIAQMGLASGDHRVVLSKNLEKALALAKTWG